MSLRLKIFYYLLVVVALFGVLNYGVQRLVVLPRFIALEQDEAKKNMMRCIEALRREIYHLDSLNHDWAAWDDTYEFVQARNEDYIEANLVISSFEDNNLDIIYIVNTKGEVVWGEIHDGEPEEKIQMADFPENALAPSHPLLAYEFGKTPLPEIAIYGIMMTPKGPMLVSSRPILTSHHGGPVRGTIIMGRFLDDEEIIILAEQTRLTLKIWPTSSDSISTEDIPLLRQITEENPFVIKKNDESLLNIYTTFPDIQGASALLMQVDIPRKIRAEGTKAFWMAMVSLLAASIIVLTVLWGLLERAVLAPIKKLTGHAKLISSSNDFSMRISIPQPDEIGALATTFDNMVSRVEEQTTDLTRINEELKTQIAEREKAQKERENLILDLQEALAEVKTLSGLLPLCASCKKVRDDKGYWRQIEAYIQDHSEAEVSHGICPECAKVFYPDYAAEMYPDSQEDDT